MPLSRLVARRVRRAIAARSGPEERASGELDIVPFLDIVTNLLLFLLATVTTVVVVAQIDARLPAPRRTGAHHGTARDPVPVTVTLTDRGFVIAGPGGFVASGCDSVGTSSAIAIPRGDEDALSSCMARIRDRVDDERVIVSADPDIPYDEILGTIDAVRARGERPLFRDVLISVGMR